MPRAAAQAKASVAATASARAFRSSGAYAGFSWHSCEHRLVLEAKQKMQEARQARNTAVDWANCLELTDGVYLPWKKAGTYAAGYDFFSRWLGALVYEAGQTSSWQVHGHRTGFDPEVLPQASAIVGQPGSALASAPAPDPPTPGTRRRMRGKTTPMLTPQPAGTQAGGGEASAARPVVPAGTGTPRSAAPVAALASSSGAGASAAGPAAAGDASAVSASAVVPSRPALGDSAGAVNACPVLLLSCRRQVLENRRDAYAWGSRAGAGTHGRCYRGRVRATGRSVVVKLLSPGADHLRNAFAEASALDRCRQHPHVVQLLDVFMSPQHPSQVNLVLDDAGGDLGQYLRACDAGLASHGVVRTVVRDTASALQHLHGQGLLHGDVKPANILIQEATPGAAVVCLGDLGSVQEAGFPGRLVSAVCGWGHA